MKYNSSAERCITCDYWAGDRELINFGNYVEGDPNTQGSCNEPDSSSRHLDNKPAQWHCPNWSKWGALK